MGGQRFIAQWRCSRHRLLQKGGDVRCRNLRHVDEFLAEPKGKEAVSNTPTLKDRSVAETTLTAEIFFISVLELSKLGVGGNRFQRWLRYSQAHEESDEAANHEAVVL